MDELKELSDYHFKQMHAHRELYNKYEEELRQKHRDTEWQPRIVTAGEHFELWRNIAKEMQTPFQTHESLALAVAREYKKLRNEV